MSKLYFGFALADSMFNDGTITRRTLSIDEVKSLIADGVSNNTLVSCCNPSHVATINAMHQRFGINVSIPDTPPKVNLLIGDSIIVMGVRGLPRLTDRHEYTDAEISTATFSFSLYEIML